MGPQYRPTLYDLGKVWIKRGFNIHADLRLKLKLLGFNVERVAKFPGQNSTKYKKCKNVRGACQPPSLIYPIRVMVDDSHDYYPKRDKSCLKKCKFPT